MTRGHRVGETDVGQGWLVGRKTLGETEALSRGAVPVEVPSPSLHRMAPGLPNPCIYPQGACLLPPTPLFLRHKQCKKDISLNPVSIQKQNCRTRIVSQEGNPAIGDNMDECGGQ